MYNYLKPHLLIGIVTNYEVKQKYIKKKDFSFTRDYQNSHLQKKHHQKNNFKFLMGIQIKHVIAEGQFNNKNRGLHLGATVVVCCFLMLCFH